ncbi:MAG: DMT family transporter [Gemmatimonadetes bacterium]|nr:MAG: DMT family transporter [Gemmatimonadota bacterium]
MPHFPYLGETLALSAAVFWSIAVILFKKSGESVHPIGLNLFKNIFAFLLVIPTLYLMGESLFYTVSLPEFTLLLLSGVIGITLGDTLFFKSLNLLGAGLSAIVDCLYSPFIIFFSIILLAERLSLWQILGTILILSAVLEASNKKSNHHIPPENLVGGIIWGILAMLTTGFGIVLAKPVLETVPLLWATEIRFIGGIGSLLILLAVHPQRKHIIRSVMGVHSWGYTVSSSFLGAYLAMICWLGGMKFTQASTAAVLNQTSNIFVFIFAALLLKEPITLQRLIGIVLAVGGALLVTFG